MGTCKGRGSGLFCLWVGWSRRKKALERGRRQVLRRSGIGRGGARREEREDAAAEFFGVKAVSRGVKRARHETKMCRAAMGFARGKGEKGGGKEARGVGGKE